MDSSLEYTNKRELKMDEYTYREIDRAMSKRIEAIYSDPKRHAFQSCFDYDESIDCRGRRNGKVRGRKTICAHCGTKKAGHASTDEQI